MNASELHLLLPPYQLICNLGMKEFFSLSSPSRFVLKKIMQLFFNACVTPLLFIFKRG